ncbi:MAG TPA: hypothetical protein VGK48_07210 [Terriglobia bacterium]|jgi:hypothetical protein
MKSKQIKAAITAALLLGTVIVFSSNTALAQQTLTLRANIPFDFYAGQKLMPAGAYRVQTIGPNVIRLTHVDSFTTVAFLVLGAPDSKDASPRIVFKAYGGGDKYLSELWWGQKGSIELPSPRERELALASSQIRVSLSAAGR